MLTDRILYNYNKTLVPYKELLAYIQSTGTQYIDTELTGGSTSAWEISLSFYTSQVSFPQWITGPQNPVNIGKIYSSSSSAATLEYVYPGSSSARFGLGVTFNTNDVYVIKYDTDGKVYVNGIQKGTGSATSGWGTVSYYLLCGHEENTSFACGRLYYCKMWKDGELARDFVPVLDKNDVPCLYEKVSNSLFYNQGTGTFQYGRL